MFNPDNILCDYGCGKIAKFQFGNGKYCCSDVHSKCDGERKKLSNSKKGKKYYKFKEINNPDNILCDYGCGKIAKFQFGNGKYCCDNNVRKCVSEVKKSSTNRLGKKNKQKNEINNPDNILCDHGCGKIAKFKFGNGKYCCENNYTKCEFVKKERFNFLEINNPDNILCDYGCGKIAKFQFGNGKYCCENNFRKCDVIYKKNCKSQTGKKMPEYISFENPDNLICDHGCGKIAKFKFKNGKVCCENHYTKCEFIRTKKYLTYQDVKIRFPDLIKYEKLISGQNNEVLGHCKNSNCKNSEENGGYFELSTGQIYFRNKGINSIRDNDYLYCCEECKKECPLFKKSAKQLHNLITDDHEINYTQQEYITFRNEVFKRQLVDNKEHTINYCEICYSIEDLQIHHIQPQKLEPGYSLDPPNGIILCQKCHLKHGHEKGSECSTGNLANKSCK